jgi:tetratricopeptide (TPR) repeat protein
MHPTKPAQKPSTTRATFSRIALALTLICTQISQNSALAQTAEISEQAIQHKLFKQGTNALGKGEFQQAIRDFSQAISITDYQAAYTFRGLSYAALKNYSAAIQDYNKALSMNPRDPISYESRGQSYAAMKNYSSAIRDYTKSIAITPNYVFAYIGRGNAYRDLKDYSSAIRDYTQAIAIAPNLADIYVNRSAVFVYINDYQSATRDARKACSLGKCQPLEFLGNLGWLRD